MELLVSASPGLSQITLAHHRAPSRDALQNSRLDNLKNHNDENQTILMFFGLLPLIQLFSLHGGRYLIISPPTGGRESLLKG
jgi:hypothetical protein